jgi:hypothetical protein
MPFLFYKYGPGIRERCKYAAQAAAFMKKMQAQTEDNDESSEDDPARSSEDPAEKEKEHEEEREEAEQEAIDYSYAEENQEPRFERIRTNRSRQSRPSLAATRSYDWSPFDLDRVNTRESFKWEAGRKVSRKSSQASKVSKK